MTVISPPPPPLIGSAPARLTDLYRFDEQLSESERAVRKRCIGNGSIVDVVVAWAGDDDGNVGGFVVEREKDGIAGYEATVITGRSGNRAVGQAEIRLGGVQVPVDNRLAESRTFADTARVLTKSRQNVAWEAVGHAAAAYEAAVGYVRWHACARNHGAHRRDPSPEAARRDVNARSTHGTGRPHCRRRHTLTGARTGATSIA